MFDNNPHRLVILLLCLLLESCTFMPNNIDGDDELSLRQDIQLNDFERKIAQKLMISIRYFCGSDSSEKMPNSDLTQNKNHCRQPVLKLPAELAQLITETEVGGVVLFSENIESHRQVIGLNQDLQLAANQSQSKRPLFIAIDQEGGRVVRLQRENSTAFSGNMAIGATYPQHGVYYASEVGRIIGSELKALGFNLNFSPDVDINNNPDNPVINVRSFGEKARVVSELGIAMMNAFQRQKIIATLKHFPGHGNTSVDSHTGLPRVDADEVTLWQIDLKPFQVAIEQAAPAMIMTAHIQYPNLDSSTMTNKNGEQIIKPATMSEKLLTGLLRERMNFKGIVITDALNMAGISHHFELQHATAASLLAGADIALMPYKIEEPKDIIGFKYFIRAVANSVLEHSKGEQIVEQSLLRIEVLKKEYLNDEKDCFKDWLKDSKKHTKQKLANADRLLANQHHRLRQQQLAYDSMTLLKNKLNQFPIIDLADNQLHIIVQDKQQLQLIKELLDNAWKSLDSTQTATRALSVSYTLLADYQQSITEKNIAQSDAVILFYSERRDSAVVKGEVDEGDEKLNQLSTQQIEANEKRRLESIHRSLSFAKKLNKKIVIAGMQSPYEMRQFIDIADVVLVAYDASIYQQPKTEKLIGVTYDAAIRVFLGTDTARGQLPVSLN